MISVLPPEFDAQIYLSSNPDLAGMTLKQLIHHYELYGQNEGRICNEIDGRSKFLALVPSKVELLEIGPYTAPAFRRPYHNVRYLDAFSTEELRAKAAATGMDALSVPEIDYVWHGEPYQELVSNTVAAIFSSHNIEHQPDLIRHLHQLGNILQPAGQLFFVVPDRRYCFDHFLRDTTFADVFGAYYENRHKHTATSVFEHRMLTTHNDSVRHWAGDHGLHPLLTPITPETVAVVHETVSRIEATPGYIDTHAWQFTPESFRALITLLAASGKISFQVERIYPTVKNSNEFYVVLVRSAA